MPTSLDAALALEKLSSVFARAPACLLLSSLCTCIFQQGEGSLPSGFSAWEEGEIQGRAVAGTWGEGLELRFPMLCSSSPHRLHTTQSALRWLPGQALAEAPNMPESTVPVHQSLLSWVLLCQNVLDPSHLHRSVAEGEKVNEAKLTQLSERPASVKAGRGSWGGWHWPWPRKGAPVC